MKDKELRKNSITNLSEPVQEKISPYDDSYPISLLTNSLKIKLEQAEKTAQEIYMAVAKEAPVLAQVQQSLDKGFRYVVDASESTLKALDAGKIKFSVEKSGKMFAQIREANGRYGPKVPIKKELFRKGIDTAKMANALQMKALQEQIQDIADQISIIDHSVREIMQGQQNDRIGLYYSGMALYLESRNVSDDELKKGLVAQSLRALSEATFQLTLSMKADIQYLLSEEYECSKVKRVQLIDAHMKSINQSFIIVHQATMLRAGIYCDAGELGAMSTVLQEYSHFIEATVAKNAGFLAQCDSGDNGTDSGIWKSRTKFMLNVSGFAEQLRLPDKTVYLGISKENDDE